MNHVCCRWDAIQHVVVKATNQHQHDPNRELLDHNNNNDDNVKNDVEMYGNGGNTIQQQRRRRQQQQHLALNNVTVSFDYGTLTAVIGPVGCGKSALLQALVQELTITSGSIQWNNCDDDTDRLSSSSSSLSSKVSYAAQDPWIMGGTIYENILMGQPYDAIWYQQVIQSCCLVMDFTKLLRDGDQTIVGDRGIQLSGGQRARIGLARALYNRNAHVLILDDPLSAVDARVGRYLFQQAILTLAMLNQNKCVILATHQHQYIHNVRCVLLSSSSSTLGGGGGGGGGGSYIQCIGSYEECVQASQGKLTAHDADTMMTDKSKTFDSMEKSTLDEEEEEEEEEEEAKSVSENKSQQQGGANFKTEQEERNKQGVVKLDTYIKYIKAFGGLWVGLFILLLFTCTQSSVLVTVATMGRWAERDVDNDQRSISIVTLVAMSITVILLAMIRAFLTLELTVKASQKLHNDMTAAVLRAKIEFFDTNPMGRILNRFSADIGITDDQLPQTLFEVMVTLFIVLGAVVTTLTTLPFALIALVFLLWYFCRIRYIFVTSTRELKRLEGAARSPIFAMLSEALGGIATIRANGYIPYFRKKFHNAHNAHTRAFFAFIAASRWIGFRMDSIVVMFLTVVSFLSVLVHNEGWFDIDPAILGLSLSMLILLSNVFQYCIRQTAEVVNHMVSVERVLEYGKLEPEAALHCDADDKLLEKGWPTAGKIEYDGVSVRYRASLPLALRKISFQIPAGARVGVVGRTGSGKSTVVQSLFRLLEPEEGRILIDDQDISKLGLHTVRTKISVIPQVPTLFSSCSVRDNLDLFQRHSDEEIQRVLTCCHLQDVIAELPHGWNSIVSEGGSNFSVGQRQLLCLARALLSQNKILVLDEATASVDRRTDQLLQQALQESYQDGTILAVAHRLDTVIDYDYILVLGQGEVLEFGSPAELLLADNSDNSGGVFAHMVDDTGEAMSKSLREKAILTVSQKKDR